MDNQFRPIYERLYESYRTTSTILPRYSGDSLAAAGAISKEIEEVQDDLRRDQLPQLREDAKYFLLLCLVEMVYVPIRLEAPQEGRFELVRSFSEDIKTIAFTASQEAKEKNRDFISTHMVVDALHNSWDKLNSGINSLWEREE